MTANICEVCGKQFIKSGRHVYKMNYKSRTKSFCSYTCWNKVIKLKENKEFDKLDEIYAKRDTRINI